MSAQLRRSAIGSHACRSEEPSPSRGRLIGRPSASRAAWPLGLPGIVVWAASLTARKARPRWSGRDSRHALRRRRSDDVWVGKLGGPLLGLWRAGWRPPHSGPLPFWGSRDLKGSFRLHQVQWQKHARPKALAEKSGTGQSLSPGATLTRVDLNSQNSPAGAFWELKSTPLKVARIEEHWIEWPNIRKNLIKRCEHL